MILLDLGALVAPGWTALLLVVILGLVITFLFFSMRKQLRRIDVPKGFKSVFGMSWREYTTLS